MARTTINSLGVPAGTITAADLTFPLTDFSSTGIDDNASSTSLTIDSSGNISVTGTVDGRDLATDGTKLDGIEANADVTDTTNVTAAGALMDSELTDLAGVKGVTISTLQPKPSEGAFADGDKTKLDGIATGADVTPSWVPSSDPNYLTSYTEVDTLNSVTGRGSTTTNAVGTGKITVTTSQQNGLELDGSHSNGSYLYINGPVGNTWFGQNGSGLAAIWSDGSTQALTLAASTGNATFSGSVTATGASFTGDVSISTTSNIPLILKDSNATGNSAEIYMEYHDQTNTRVGYVGMGSGSNGDNYLFAANGSPHLYSGNSSAPKYNNNTIWHAGNDGSGSGLDADLLDGQQGSYYTSLANATGEFSTISATSASSRDKIRVYPNSNYAIGMQDNITYGHLNDWAMTFQMNDDAQSDRGFWWGDVGHGLGNGAMSLTVNGRATIANSLSIGQGESITGPSAATLYVNGASTFTSVLTIDHNTSNMLHIRPTNGSPWAINIQRDDLGASRVYTHNYSSAGLGWVFEHMPYDYNGGSPGKLWGATNDGSGSGLDADTVDGIQGASFLRSDADDTVNAGVTYTWSATNTEGLIFQNASYTGNYLYIGGWSGTNSSGISRIRNSNANLHLDSGSNGSLYLNHYSGGAVYARQNIVWHGGNDGSGSGLDADTLDGIHKSGMWANMDGAVRTNYTLKFRAPSSAYAGIQFDSQANTSNYAGFFLHYGGTSTSDVYTADGITLVADRGWLSLAQRTTSGKGVRIMSGTTSTERLKITTAGDIQFVNGNSFTYGGNTIWHAGNDGSGSGLDADTVDGVQAASMVQLTGTQSITGIKYFNGNRNTTSSNPPLQVYGTTSGAIMSFHRGGFYAVNFGLDSDNVMRIGGWSAPANRWQLDMSGNMTVAGNVTAYSDIRFKEAIEVIPDALSKVQQLRGVTFTRNDVEDLEKRHTGVIAQELEVVLPEAVSEDNNGIKNVAYGNMVGLLIEAIKEQQAQIEELKEIIKCQ